MKVIDLLNKIANGEEIEPIDYKGEESLTYYLYDKCGKECDDTNLADILNDEVEIIEDKKIRKIKVNYSPDIEEKIFYEDGDKPRHCVLGDAGTELLINKINEIIDKLNEMEKE